MHQNSDLSHVIAFGLLTLLAPLNLQATKELLQKSSNNEPYVNLTKIEKKDTSDLSNSLEPINTEKKNVDKIRLAESIKKFSLLAKNKFLLYKENVKNILYALIKKISSGSEYVKENFPNKTVKAYWKIVRQKISAGTQYVKDLFPIKISINFGNK